MFIDEYQHEATDRRVFVTEMSLLLSGGGTVSMLLYVHIIFILTGRNGVFGCAASSSTQFYRVYH